MLCAWLLSCPFLFIYFIFLYFYFFFIFIYFICLQTSSTMSRRSTLSREELEVQDALREDTPVSVRNNIINLGTPDPGQRAPVAQVSPPLINIGSVQQLSETIARSLMLAINPNFEEANHVPPAGLSHKRPHEVMDLPAPTGGPLIAKTASPIRFGVDVNPPPQGAEDGKSHSPLDLPAVQTPVTSAVIDAAPTSTGLVPVTPVAPAPQVSGEVAPDAALPPTSTDDPPNWSPDEGVMAWAALAVDSCEWSGEDRKLLMKKFVPEPKYAHLFEAVHMPPDIISAMKDKRTVQADYLFNRYTAETYFYNSNLDLTTCFRPLLEVISNLTRSPEHENDRYLLGRVFQGMVSSTVKLSRGRRELGRRFVPLANAPALFRTKPSHKSIFGGDSIESAVEEAVKVSKGNRSLVYKHKSVQQPFRATGSYGRGFQGYQYQYQYQKPQYPFKDQSGGGSSRQQRGRQKGRGGRGRGRQPNYPSRQQQQRQLHQQ